MPTNKPLPVAQHYPLPVALPIAQHYPLPEALPVALPVAQFRAPLIPPLDAGGGEPVYEAIRYTAQDLAMPMNRWVRFMSTYLWAMCFQPYGTSDHGDLQLEFVDGFIGLWEDCPASYAMALYHAPSKGKCHHAWDRYHGPYQTIREQLYEGEELRARIEANHMLRG